MTVLEEIKTQTGQITLTAAAAQVVQDLLSKRNLTGYALRVFVSGGGCSGFQYGMALDNRIRPTDLVIDQHGVQMVVDEVSIDYLNGATVDYVDEVTGAGFKIENPNMVSSCGCGKSEHAADGETSECGCGGGGGCGCH